MSFVNFRRALDNDLAWHLFLAFNTIALVLMLNDVAVASSSTNDVVGIALCKLVANLTGGIAKGIATLAIFAVGIGLFLGKVNWPIAAMTAVGVGVIFGAPKVVAWLGGDSGLATCPTS